MSFVVDEKVMEFVGDSIEFGKIEDAVYAARIKSRDSSNMFTVCGFEDEDPSYIFIDGICYKPFKYTGLNVVK